MQINIIADTVENESMNRFECQIWLCKMKTMHRKGIHALSGNRQIH